MMMMIDDDDDGDAIYMRSKAGSWASLVYRTTQKQKHETVE